MIKERLLSVEDICQYLGLSRDTVYKWIDRKNMPAHKWTCRYKRSGQITAQRYRIVAKDRYFRVAMGITR